MATYSKRDLSIVPFMTFSFVELYIKSHKASSGGKPISRGLTYFMESFVHDLKGELLIILCIIPKHQFLYFCKFYEWNIYPGTDISSFLSFPRPQKIFHCLLT